MAAGEGFLSDVHWHFYTDAAARHWALGERQPAYPAILALALRLSPTDAAAQLATILIGALTVAALTYLAGHLYGPAAAAATAILASLSTVMILAGTVLEPVGLHALWLSLLVLSVLAAARDWRWALATGLLITLLHLTRGEGLVTGTAALLWLACARHWRALALAVLAACLSLLPYWLLNASTNGSPFYSQYADHLRVKVFAEGMWYGYGKSFPSTAEFLRGHWPYALRTWTRNAGLYFLSVFGLSWVGLGMAALAVAVVARRVAAGSMAAALPPFWTVPLTLGAAHCAAVATMWSTTSGRPEPQHLAPPLAALALPLAAWGVAKLARDRVLPAAALAAVLAAAYLPADLAALAARPVLLDTAESVRPACAAADPFLGPDDVIASCRPWLLWWEMRRPVVILPRDLSPAGRAHFLRRFKVRAIVDWSPGALPWLEVPGVTRLLVTPSAGPLALLVAPTPPAPLPPGG